MAIKNLSDVPHENLVGKFICAPSIVNEQEYGYPAMVEKVTKFRMTYRKLARGDWLKDINEWEVLPQVEEENPYGDGPRQCNISSLHFVCDTPEEAIQLYWNSKMTRYAIEEFRKKALASVDARALAGELDMPPYLNKA